MNILKNMKISKLRNIYYKIFLIKKEEETYYHINVYYFI